MKKMTTALLLLLTSLACQADTGEVRDLSEVFSDSEVIVSGLIAGAQLAPCNGEARAGAYTLQISFVMKGKIPRKDEIRMCGPAPMLLSNEYIIAGNINAQGDLIFQADAAILFVPFDKYYRLIAYDSPHVKSDRGNAYSVGIEEPDFSSIFGKQLNLKKTIERKTQ